MCSTKMDKEDEKFLKNHIDVYVCIDMVCGDTKKVFESEDE